jgi:hypothetical protein
MVQKRVTGQLDSRFVGFAAAGASGLWTLALFVDVPLALKVSTSLGLLIIFTVGYWFLMPAHMGTAHEKRIIVGTMLTWALLAVIVSTVVFLAVR